MSELTLTLRQPAQVGDRARSDFVLGTLDHLPGAVVRGALAAAWIARHGAPVPSSRHRDEFVQLFEGEVRFGTLLATAEVTSLALVGHKYPAGGQCAEIEFDRALRDDVPARCPDCRSPLEHSREPRGDVVRLQRRTSVAIATSGVALRGLLVTRETLDAGQSFSGTVTASDRRLLEIVADLGQVRVGGRRTTHGVADVQVTDGPAPPTAQRRDDGCLVIRLRSPGIFTDDHGRPARDPNLKELADVLGCPAQIRGRWTRWQTVGGWHIASGLPKPTELAVAPGSTYVVEPDMPVTDDAIARLGQRGLGLRRHEGFGDLANPIIPAPGRQARIAEATRRGKLMDEVAGLLALRLKGDRTWRLVTEQLASHAAGDRRASALLRRMEAELDQSTAGGLNAFLRLGPDDASYVARELGAR